MDASQSIWRRGIYLTVVVLVLFLQWKGDYLNAFFAKRKALPGTDVCRAHFYPEFYETEIAGVQTQWQYTKVQALVETKDYIILILGKNQAQAYDKRGLEGRSVREFCGFLSRKTGLHVQTFLRCAAKRIKRLKSIKNNKASLVRPEGRPRGIFYMQGALRRNCPEESKGPSWCKIPYVPEHFSVFS